MAVRTDLHVLWYLSPRIVVVEAPSIDISIQDLHDTLRFIEDTPEAEGYDLLIDSAGKDNLGGGVQVGITATMLNARLAFEGRHTPSVTGSATSADPTGVILTDSGADFVAAGVLPGDCLVNYADQSMTDILEVISPTQLRTVGLNSGSDNQWEIGDSYRVYAVAQCSVSGGNLVAVDDQGDTIPAIVPTAHVQVVVAASTSASVATPSSAFKRGVAFPNFTFTMVAESTRLPTAGYTVTAERKTDGGAWVPLDGTVVSVGGGTYTINLSAVDLVGRSITLRFSASGAVTRTMTLITSD